MASSRRHEVEIARITAKQAIVVAIISAATGIVTTLLGAYVVRANNPETKREDAELVAARTTIAEQSKRSSS
jgi:zinc transporter ZupT